MDYCLDCKYFRPRSDIDNTTEGTCRLHPPRPIKANGHEVWRWPIVEGDKRACGDYKKNGA